MFQSCSFKFYFVKNCLYGSNKLFLNEKHVVIYLYRFNYLIFFSMVKIRFWTSLYSHCLICLIIISSSKIYFYMCVCVCLIISLYIFIYLFIYVDIFVQLSKVISNSGKYLKINCTELLKAWFKVKVKRCFH